MKTARLTAILVAAMVVTVACGSNSTPEQAPAPAATATKSSAPSTIASSSAPVTPGELLSQGIVIYTPELGGGQEPTLTSYDPSGSENGSVTFSAPEGADGSLVACGIDSTDEDGSKRRTLFNEDFSKLFVARKDAASQASVIGYYGANDSEYHQLSVAGGQFADVDHRCPSYHAASKRIYFWDYSGGKGQPVLSSMPDAGGPVQAETVLQEPLDFYDTFFMANAEAPVVLRYSRDTAVNDAGTLAAVAVSNGIKLGPAGDPIKLANDTPVATFDKDLELKSVKYNQQPSAVGFVNDSSVVFTDGQRIFRADVQNGQSVVTTLLENANENTEVFNVAISSDRQSYAFLTRVGTVTTLFVGPLDDSSQPSQVTTFNDQIVKILQFNK